MRQVMVQALRLETNSEFKFQHERLKGSQPYYNSSTTQSKNNNEAISCLSKTEPESSASSTLLASLIEPWQVLTRHLLRLRAIQEGRLITSLKLMWSSGFIPTTTKVLTPSPIQIICFLYRHCPWSGPERSVILRSSEVRINCPSTLGKCPGTTSWGVGAMDRLV